MLSAGRKFPRYKAQPRGQIADLLELSPVSNGGKECGCPQRSDARDRHETSRNIFATGDRLDLACDVTNALLQLAQIDEQLCEQLTHY
uniref:hypothetical protein n=1 Tax=Shinella sp. PSBB067 TaxID=2715959 RepID=UPI00351C652A